MEIEQLFKVYEVAYVEIDVHCKLSTWSTQEEAENTVKQLQQDDKDNAEGYCVIEHEVCSIKR